MAENPDDRLMLLGANESLSHVMPLFTCICAVPLKPIIPTWLVLVLILLTKQAAITSPVCTTNCGEVGIEICVQEVEAVVIRDALYLIDDPGTRLYELTDDGL